MSVPACPELWIRCSINVAVFSFFGKNLVLAFFLKKEKKRSFRVFCWTDLGLVMIMSARPDADNFVS